jgi:hypothetical protein
MMNITLKSTVHAELTSVHNRFDQHLFSYLLPPGAKLIAYGGSKKGDIVHLKLPLAGEWISEITENGMSTDMYYFIDEGRKLPFPLKKWKHKHLLRRSGNGTTIEDHMRFSTGFMILDILVYPFLLLAFLPRVWQYKSYFNK